MNRIQRWAETSPAENPPAARAEGGVLRLDRDSSESPYALFAPLHYEKNYAYPLLVWLHGPQDDQRQLPRIMPLISMRNYVAVAPRGTAPDEESGFTWSESPADIELATQRIFECIEIASSRYHIAPHRVFLAGFRTGGTLAFRVALEYPERFAGVLSVGGPFPSGDSPLRNLVRARRLPLFVTHGRDSAEYSTTRACGDLRLFHSAGLIVSLRQYPCGDVLTTHMLRAMDVWMMELVTGVSCPIEENWVWRPGEVN